MLNLLERKVCGALVWLLAALGFWLLPFWKLAAKSSVPIFLPSRWRLQMASAAVFIHHNTSWSQAITLMRDGPSSEWMPIPSAEITPLQIAGYRYRWDRLVWDVRKKKLSALWPRAAGYVAMRWCEAYPERGKATEFRVVRVLRRCTDPAVIHPAGHWEVSGLEGVATADLTELSYCKLKNGVWVSAGKWKAPQVTIPQVVKTETKSNNGSLIVRRRPVGKEGVPSGSPSLLPLIRPAPKNAAYKKEADLPESAP
jgi:hypothetical protein